MCQADRLQPVADGGGKCPAAGLAVVRQMVSFRCRVAVSAPGGGVSLGQSPPHSEVRPHQAHPAAGGGLCVAVAVLRDHYGHRPASASLVGGSPS